MRRLLFVRQHARGSRVLWLLPLVALPAVGAGAAGDHLRLTVMPRSASFDVSFTIRASGLPPRRRAAIFLHARAKDGRPLHGELVGRADGNGVVLLRDRYLFERLHAGDHGWPSRITFTLAAAHATTSAQATRHPISTGSLLTTDERPARVGFYGEWIRPRSARHQTAILLLGGSEGGMSQGTLADTLAAHGYPVLELAYFAEPGLARTLRRIPLEYFERALKWLAQRPQVDPKRIVTFGWSYGGEASLLLASTFPALVHGAIGYVPSAWVSGAPADPSVPAWTHKGRPIPWYRSNADRSRALIPVWRNSGPVFVVGGLDDKVWPSGFYAREVAKQMRRHGRHDVTALAYSGAGHLLYQAIPLQIKVSAQGYGAVSTNYGRLDFGGSPQADEAGREDSWPRLLRFLSALRRT